ncbi:O-antigen ligase [Panacagrimonas perspica]|uniref:O-antigen ligase n=1 Tax=Panacagrimonas perspica TaxID=381431 RepID=A0A4S3KB05_9GAMM|nr:O-antigen ligase family protein [Panacagrimonas perspica]TDU28700.1 O-antigen ligase [Panacagrimonas perspica]THD05024.1 hypothetical protein B1810_03520 [Panacagrimonas perspica]
MSSWFASAIWIVGFSYAFLHGDLIGIGFRDKWSPLLAIALAIVAARAQLFMAMLPFINPGMILLLGWCLLSALWAPSAVFVLTQAISVIGVSMIAVAFSLSGWHPGRFESRLAFAVNILLVASIFTAVFYPAIGVHSGTDVSLRDAWLGVTYQKNGLGQLSAVGMILWTYLWASRRARAVIAAAGFALCLFTVVKSRSSTSLLLAMISCAGVVALLRPRISLRAGTRKLIIGALAVVLPIGIYIAVATPYLGFIGRYFGKDGTFSGRKEIWDALILEIEHRPILGTGLNSFWGGADAGEARVRAAVGWAVRNGHNGYLDVANELGLVGLALLIFFLGWYCVSLVRLARISRDHFALHLPLFVYVVLANTTESGWFFLIAPAHLVGMYASVEISRLLFAHAANLRAKKRQLALQKAGSEAPVAASRSGSIGAPPASGTAPRG